MSKISTERIRRIIEGKRIINLTKEELLKWHEYVEEASVILGEVKTTQEFVGLYVCPPNMPIEVKDMLKRLIDLTRKFEEEMIKKGISERRYGYYLKRTK